MVRVLQTHTNIIIFDILLVIGLSSEVLSEPLISSHQENESAFGECGKNFNFIASVCSEDFPPRLKDNHFWKLFYTVYIFVADTRVLHSVNFLMKISDTFVE